MYAFKDIVKYCGGLIKQIVFIKKLCYKYIHGYKSLLGGWGMGGGGGWGMSSHELEGGETI